MIKVGILGASGYTGAELIRLLSKREDVELIFIHSNSYEGKSVSSLYPNLREIGDLTFTTIEDAFENKMKYIDVLFCALPHGLTQKAVKDALDLGVKVIDLSADFRLKDPVEYEKWYDTKHNATDELKEAVYGLVEINRDKIKDARLIANPGCYPTSITLGLYPLLKENLVKGTIISDSKSGVSGAGRATKDGNLYCQCDESISPYGVASHRHTPEIKEQLNYFTENEVDILFTPHLVPMMRGILSTIYVKNDNNLEEDEILEIYHKYYDKEKFIRVLPKGVFPKTREVSGSNYVDIAVKVDNRTGYIIVMSVIDNLFKGASGQAVQNMNVMFGLDESKGIDFAPMWP